jgi:hypothetical protein
MQQDCVDSIRPTSLPCGRTSDDAVQDFADPSVTGLRFQPGERNFAFIQTRPRFRGLALEIDAVLYDKEFFDLPAGIEKNSLEEIGRRRRRQLR